jgi:hypothetical protein
MELKESDGSQTKNPIPMAIFSEPWRKKSYVIWKTKGKKMRRRSVEKVNRKKERNWSGMILAVDVKIADPAISRNCWSGNF